MLELDLTQRIENKDLTYKDNKLVFSRSIDDVVLIKRKQTNLDIEILDGVKVSLIEYFDLLDNVEYRDNVVNKGHFNHQKIYQGKAENCHLIANVQNDGDNYTLTLLDLNNGGIQSEVSIDTNKEAGESYLYFASLCSHEEKKIINKITNKAPHTIGIMENYGVSMNKGLLDIVGVGDIKHDCIQATNRQKSNLVIMDEEAKAISRPYLYIDENDVIASHASAVGEISEEQLFYLLSRGISKEDARKMIVLGYFQPVINRLEHDETKESVAKYIEGVIFYA